MGSKYRRSKIGHFWNIRKLENIFCWDWKSIFDIYFATRVFLLLRRQISIFVQPSNVTSLGLGDKGLCNVKLILNINSDMKQWKSSLNDTQDLYSEHFLHAKISKCSFVFNRVCSILDTRADFGGYVSAIVGQANFLILRD